MLKGGYILNKKLLKNSPYQIYRDNRSFELVKELANVMANGRHVKSCVAFMIKLCQMVSLDETQLLENQAMLDDDSFDEHDVRLNLLKSFNRNFIDMFVSGSDNHSLSQFKSKGGDDK